MLVLADSNEIKLMHKSYRNILLMIGLYLVISQEVGGQNREGNVYPPGELINKLSERKAIRFRNDTIMMSPRWFIPDHYKVQYAGAIGFLSVGAGYNVRDRYEPTLLLGYLNHAFGNSSRSVVTVSLKNSFFLLKRQMPENFNLKTGLSINWGNTNNTFDKLPPHYAEKYYFQNKIHASPFFGGEWSVKLRDKHLKSGGIFFEVNTLDAYLLEFFRTKYVGFDEIWNLALGITVYLH